MSSPDHSKLKVSSSSGTGDGFSDREQSKLEGGAELLLASPGDSSSSSTSGEYLVHAPNAQRKVTSRMEQLNAANVGTSVFPVCCFFGSFHSFLVPTLNIFLVFFFSCPFISKRYNYLERSAYPHHPHPGTPNIAGRAPSSILPHHTPPPPPPPHLASLITTRTSQQQPSLLWPLCRCLCLPFRFQTTCIHQKAFLR